jgi:antimicrobial peptide system SdpA family protein
MRTGSALTLDATVDTAVGDPVQPRGRPDRAISDLGLGWRLVTLVMLAVVIVLYVLRGALPVTPFSVPDTPERNYARVFVPQGWAFFTGSPRVPHLTVIGNHNGQWRVLSPGRLAVPEDLMGLDRVRQARYSDLNVLVGEVPDAAWSDCDTVPTDCVTGLPAGPVIANPSPRREVCGDIGLIAQEVVPWAWRNMPTVMPSRVARATVTC